MSGRREIEKAIRRRDECIAVLRGLGDATIADFVRRARHRPRDGFPSTSTGASDVHGGRSSTPVEARVLARAGGREDKPDPDTWPPEDDPVGDAITEVFETLHEISRHCEVVQRNRRYVEHSKDAAKDESVKGIPSCNNPHCHDLAEIAGRCRPCYFYYRDHGLDASAETIERRMQRRMRAS